MAWWTSALARVCGLLARPCRSLPPKHGRPMKCWAQAERLATCGGGQATTLVAHTEKGGRNSWCALCPATCRCYRRGA
eukprot:1063026-Pleurochrysis_carterae.AAC.1